MPSKSLTCKIDQRSIEKFVKEQRLLGDRITLSDETCAGLKLVINNKSCSWAYSYRKRGYLDGGKRHPQRTMKLGDPVSMSPAEARLAAETIKSQVRAGEDPALTSRAIDRARRAEEARKRTCVQWLQQYSSKQMQSGATKYQRDELRHVGFALHELSLEAAYPEEITSKQIRDLADMHQARPATGRHRLGAMSRFLDFLLDEEVIAVNPVGSVSKRRKPKPPPPRENYFTPEQLAALWNAEGLKSTYQRYLRFMITCPLRAGEAANLTWDQVDRDRSEVRLSAEDTKNSEHFVMPLSSIAAQVIWSPEQMQSELVFPLSSVDDTHLILDGEVRVYRRERSKRWQAAFVIDGHTIRISTGKRDLAEAKEYARDTFLEYKFRHKNDLPVVTKKFSDVAKLAIADMRKQLDAGLGRKVFADYIVCIERYLIPFFGAQYVTTIDYEKVQQSKPTSGRKMLVWRSVLGEV